MFDHEDKYITNDVCLHEIFEFKWFHPNAQWEVGISLSRSSFCV